MTSPAAPISAHPLAHALRQVVLAERARHLAFVRHQMPSATDPEDIVQLALLRAAQHLGEVREGSKLGAWFWTILRHTVLDENERQARERKARESLANQTPEPTPQEVASCACSLGVLHDLKAEYRTLLERVDIQEEPLARVASDVGITVNNATVRLHRARKALREALLGHCGTDSLRACQDCGCEDETSPR